MHSNFSFDFGDRLVSVGDWRLSFLLYTDENVYTPDPASLKVVESAGRVVISADGFAYAGLQQRLSGLFRAEANLVEGGLDLRMEARLPGRIKGSAVLLRTPAITEIADGDYGWTTPGSAPIVLRYPKTSSRFPVFPLRHGDGRCTTVASLDTELRSKIVAAVNHAREAVVELHHQEHASRWCGTLMTPTWCIRHGADPAPLFELRRQIMENAWNLAPWDRRPDVPAWARQLGLVLNLHGMHWTGFVFNTYRQQLDAIRRVTQHLDGRHVLAFLCAWDGRYNFNWPRYQACERMGGPAELQRLVEEAHQLGVHVIPQIGALSANRAYLPPALHDAAWQDAYGNAYVKDVDWDGDRQGDTYRVNANLNHPAFCTFLLDQALGLLETYAFDGIFLDINMHHQNDPRFDPLAGHRAFTAGIKQRFPESLIFGENWFDALMPFYPLVHSVNAKGRGVMRQHGDLFERYCRTTYHLIHPAPGGSTGVYETGMTEPYEPDPEVNAIPALSIVHDTLTAHGDAVDRHIGYARRYLQRQGRGS